MAYLEIGSLTGMSILWVELLKELQIIN